MQFPFQRRQSYHHWRTLKGKASWYRPLTATRFWDSTKRLYESQHLEAVRQLILSVHLMKTERMAAVNGLSTGQWFLHVVDRPQFTMGLFLQHCRNQGPVDQDAAGLNL